MQAFRSSVLTAVIVALLPLPALHAQQQFQLYIVATDAAGLPVTDLTQDEIEMRENGATGRVVRLERYRWPVKVTVLVDNGYAMRDALVHQRTGLRAFFDALPPDVEVSLIATAPNPRWLARATTDRVRIVKGVDLLTSDDGLPRSNDAFVEYAQRLDDEFRRVGAERPQPYLPVLVSIATTGRDGGTVLRDALAKMLNSFARYRVGVYVAMISIGGRGGLNDGAHATVAKVVQEVTGGRYEGLADSNRLRTLLPEIGRQIAATHIKQVNQYRVTLERPAGATGRLNDLQVSIGRNGITYTLTTDGRVAVK